MLGYVVEFEIDIEINDLLSLFLVDVSLSLKLGIRSFSCVKFVFLYKRYI